MYLLCAVILFSGCTVKEQIRVDIDKFIRDQASYINEDVIITATLEDVVSRYDLYREKRLNFLLLLVILEQKDSGHGVLCCKKVRILSAAILTVIE